MTKRKYLISLLIFIILSGTGTVYSQKSEIYTNQGNDFRKGKELYEKEKYGAAKHFFEKILETDRTDQSGTRTEAAYYLAMCSVELQNLDAEYLVYKFAMEHPESPLVNRAYFRLANYMYIKKNWPKTIADYNKTDRYYLSKDELSEYWFQKGYAYYMRRDYGNARVAFYEIKDSDTRYSSPALYYYSHIAYIQKNYQTALEGFLRLLDDETFSPVAPYYVAQIYYLQKKFSKVTEFAPPLMKTVSKKRAPEMAKIIGESYFYLSAYDQAIPFLEQYKEAVRNTTIGDKYQLAFSYYMTGKYLEAAQLFERISLNQSEVSQSALYHLAGCYLKLGDKNKARAAFASAARMNFDQDISEDALFNYAKVTYELSYTPFNEAIRAFNTYITRYPASRRTDEAYNFLVMAYMNTRNYRMALESLEKIKNKDSEIERAYQRVAFFRGLELFTNLRFNDAISVLDNSLKYSKYDAAIRARTYYWLAEAYYRMGDTPTAEDYYDLFLNEPVAVQTPEFKDVNYSMGYLEFSRKNYSKAESWFRRYVNLEHGGRAVTLADAYNRLGDCRFVQSSYWQAIGYYDKVIGMGKADVDYAYFQKAFTLGLVDRPQRKIETLQELRNKYPNSAYNDDALYELGRTFVLLNDPQEARKNYAMIVSDYPGSSYLSRTLIQLGLIASNAGRNEEALGYYKQVINDYPGTTEATNALKSIKNIYVDMNDVDGYLAYVSEIGQGVSVSEQDSLLYTAAENTYLNGDCEQAVGDLDDYLRRFPQGAFLLNANYYRADCLLKLDKPDDAFSSLMYIIGQPANMFSEPALVAASRIAYKRKDYNQAAGLYQKLISLAENKANINEAEINLMRCYANLGEYQHTIEAANQVLLQDKLEPSVAREAKYLIADAYFKQKDMPAAYDWYARIDDEVNSEQGAEAKYRMAEIDYNRGEKDQAEKEIMEFIDMNTPHQYWMGKAFLLLSDIYLSKNDDFQAVQTLESVINYYTVEDDGIKAEAVRRKQEITRRVDEENQPAGADSLYSEPDSIF